MRKLYLGMVVLALAALPAAVSAQQPAPRRAMRLEMRGMMFGNPAEMILRHQAQLNLSPDQLEKLGKIRDHFREENGEQLAKAQKEWDEIAAKYGQPPYSAETQEKVDHDRAEARKHYAKLFENSRKSREEAMEVLSSSQREQLRADMRARMGDMGDMDRDHDRH